MAYFELAITNYFFWINLFVVTAFILSMFIYSKEIHIYEVLIQISVSFLFLLIVGAISLSGYNIQSKEVFNGKIIKFEYYEAWTERVRHEQAIYRTNSKGESVYVRTDVWYTNDRHPEEYWMKTTINGGRINKTVFNKAIREFGSKFVDISHSNQVSKGDGNMYISYPTKNICVTKWHTYNNWIRASRYTIYKKQGLDYLLEQHKNNLVDYPVFIKGKYNQDYLYRVINKTSYKLDDVEHKLSEWCSVNSYKYQVNVILYVVENSTLDFKQALDYHWKGVNKNDSVIILNVENGKITWADDISFTENGLYHAEIKNFSGLSLESDKDLLTIKVLNNLESNWERIPMAKFEALKSDITMSLKSQLIIIFLHLMMCGGLFYWFMTNDIKK